MRTATENGAYHKRLLQCCSGAWNGVNWHWFLFNLSWVLLCFSLGFETGESEMFEGENGAWIGWRALRILHAKTFSLLLTLAVCFVGKKGLTLLGFLHPTCMVPCFGVGGWLHPMCPSLFLRSQFLIGIILFFNLCEWLNGTCWILSVSADLYTLISLFSVYDYSPILPVCLIVISPSLVSCNTLLHLGYFRINFAHIRY